MSRRYKKYNSNNNSKDNKNVKTYNGDSSSSIHQSDEINNDGNNEKIKVYEYNDLISEMKDAKEVLDALNSHRLSNEIDKLIMYLMDQNYKLNKKYTKISNDYSQLLADFRNYKKVSRSTASYIHELENSDFDKKSLIESVKAFAVSKEQEVSEKNRQIQSQYEIISTINEHNPNINGTSIHEIVRTNEIKDKSIDYLTTMNNDLKDKNEILNDKYINLLEKYNNTLINYKYRSYQVNVMREWTNQIKEDLIAGHLTSLSLLSQLNSHLTNIVDNYEIYSNNYEFELENDENIKIIKEDIKEISEFIFEYSKNRARKDNIRPINPHKDNINSLAEVDDQIREDKNETGGNLTIEPIEELDSDIEENPIKIEEVKDIEDGNKENIVELEDMELENENGINKIELKDLKLTGSNKEIIKDNKKEVKCCLNIIENLETIDNYKYPDTLIYLIDKNFVSITKFDQMENNSAEFLKNEIKGNSSLKHIYINLNILYTQLNIIQLDVKSIFRSMEDDYKSFNNTNIDNFSKVIGGMFKFEDLICKQVNKYQLILCKCGIISELFSYLKDNYKINIEIVKIIDSQLNKVYNLTSIIDSLLDDSLEKFTTIYNGKNQNKLSSEEKKSKLIKNYIEYNTNSIKNMNYSANDYKKPDINYIITNFDELCEDVDNITERTHTLQSNLSQLLTFVDTNNYNSIIYKNKYVKNCYKFEELSNEIDYIVDVLLSCSYEILFNSTTEALDKITNQVINILNLEKDIWNLIMELCNKIGNLEREYDISQGKNTSIKISNELISTKHENNKTKLDEQDDLKEFMDDLAEFKDIDDEEDYKNEIYPEENALELEEDEDKKEYREVTKEEMEEMLYNAFDGKSENVESELKVEENKEENKEEPKEMEESIDKSDLKRMLSETLDINNDKDNNKEEEIDSNTINEDIKELENFVLNKPTSKEAVSKMLGEEIERKPVEFTSNPGKYETKNGENSIDIEVSNVDDNEIPELDINDLLLDEIDVNNVKNSATRYEDPEKLLESKSIIGENAKRSDKKAINSLIVDDNQIEDNDNEENTIETEEILLEDGKLEDKIIEKEAVADEEVDKEIETEEKTKEVEEKSSNIEENHKEIELTSEVIDKINENAKEEMKPNNYDIDITTIKSEDCNINDDDLDIVEIEENKDINNDDEISSEISDEKADEIPEESVDSVLENFSLDDVDITEIDI